jgi:hypothetical protein
MRYLQTVNNNNFKIILYIVITLLFIYSCKSSKCLLTIENNIIWNEKGLQYKFYSMNQTSMLRYNMDEAKSNSLEILNSQELEDLISNVAKCKLEQCKIFFDRPGLYISSTEYSDMMGNRYYEGITWDPLNKTFSKQKISLGDAVYILHKEKKNEE